MSKMENEMKAVFQQKVAEKETKLKQSEEEVIVGMTAAVCAPSRDEGSAGTAEDRAGREEEEVPGRIKEQGQRSLQVILTFLN